MFYWVKIIHVVSAALLFGVGVATVIYYIYMHQQPSRSGIIKINQQIGYVDWVFIATAGMVQPMTGFMLIYLKNYPVTMTWWVMVMLGYALAGVCWFPAVYLRHQCLQLAESHDQLSTTYYRYYHWRCTLSYIAFAILIIVFYLMANVPQPK